MKTKYYVTVQLTNGGIESLEVELDLRIERADYDTFKYYVDEYDDMNCTFDNAGSWKLGHIIAWSKIETE